MGVYFYILHINSFTLPYIKVKFISSEYKSKQSEEIEAKEVKLSLHLHHIINEIYVLSKIGMQRITLMMKFILIFRNNKSNFKMQSIFFKKKNIYFNKTSYYCVTSCRKFQRAAILLECKQY